MKRIFTLLFVMLMLIGSFAACGGEDAPLTSDTSDVSDTQPVVTEPAETAPVVVAPEPTYELLNLDFETELTLADYVAATDGIELNATLNGGVISDGKWVYNGAPMALKDDIGIFDLDYYSVEFDFCFSSFVNKDGTSVFSAIADDDGVLNGESSFYIPFKMDMNGTVYHASAKTASLQLETDRVYHYKLDVDNVSKKATVSIDGTLLSAPSYNKKILAYNCFRFMDVSRGADMWIDNITVIDTEAVQNASSSKFAKAVDGAYTRGGQHGDTVQPLADGTFIDIKYQVGDENYCREGFVKFDISKLIKGKVGYAMLNTSFSIVDSNSEFDIYLVNSDWDSKTITYNNMPLGKLIFEGVKFGSSSAMGDFAPYINEALENGEKYISVRIVPTVQGTSSQTRLWYTDINKPFIAVYDEKPTKNYFEKLCDDEAKNNAIWDYAQQMYDEWYARYKALPGVNEDAVLLGRDEGQYTKTNYASPQSTNYASSKSAYKSRPFEALTDLDEYVSDEFKNAKLDKYGGIMVESLKQKATGYFYTTKIDGRWWMIDPLGYPYISVGLSDIHYSQLGSKLQKDNALKLYGDYDNWALETTKQVRDELCFNNTFRPVVNIINLDDGLPFGAYGYLMAGYGDAKGVRGNGGGSTVFTENNTMPVFDPDFVAYADSWAKTYIKYADNDRLIGYTSDNELPMNADMLDRALSVNHTKEANFYTYACTWTWLCNMTGKDNPSVADITDELRDLYRGFVWDRYYYVASKAIKTVDPNHMYLGTRFLTASIDSEWVYRFAAQYLDCMTINWYFAWEPQSEALYGIEKNGDLPFIVTEFYTKAGDSGLKNTSGAGWYVATQADRADFYETFTIRLLESSNCVGWQWFQYMDNDPNSGTGDASSIDSNKGIYRSDFTLYTEFTDRMTILNKNAYNIIDYFNNKK